MRLGPASSAVTLTVTIASVAVVPAARAQRWDDATAAALGDTADASNRVELADLDGDGWVDLLFANGDGEAGAPEPQRVFRNLGNWAQAGPHFADVTADVLGAAATRLSRVVLAGDVDGDGDLDLFVGGAYGTASGLFLRRAGGGYDDVSATNLPAGDVALADAAFGDVDLDGDLDLIAADWGGPPRTAAGPVRLWKNDGSGRFAAAPVPAVAIAEASDLELVDVDDDGDLDLMVACARCDAGVLWVGDGAGGFTDASARLPAGSGGGARAVAALDVDGDGDLDLAIADDGPEARESILVNTGGRFEDRTAMLLPAAANPAGREDRALAFADVDGDRDVDVIVGSRSDPDRVLRNDGAGGFALVDGALPLATPGTTALALVDLDHDGRVDVVQAQDGGLPDVVQLAAAGNRADGVPPVVRVLRRATPADRRVIARVHDRRSAARPHDFRRVVVEIAGPGTRPALPMRWLGGDLWMVTVPDEPAVVYRVCATDVAGNPNCSADLPVEPPVDAGADATTDAPAGGGGCCSTGGARDGVLPALAVLIAIGGRRRRGVAR